MEKHSLKNQVLEKSKALNSALESLTDDKSVSVEHIGNTIKIAHDLLRALSVYEYLLMKREISEDIDLHLKIIESSSPELRSEPLPIQPAIVKLSPPQQEKLKTREIETKPSSDEKSSVENPMKPATKKIEIGINDRYRILNELFNQNQAEFNMVISEMNAVESIAQAELYLGKLCELYGWKQDSPLVLLLTNLVKKRFI